MLGANSSLVMVYLSVFRNLPSTEGALFRAVLVYSVYNTSSQCIGMPAAQHLGYHIAVAAWLLLQ